MRASEKTKSISGDMIEIFRDAIREKSPVPSGFPSDGCLLAPVPRPMSPHRAADLAQPPIHISGETKLIQYHVEGL